MDIQALLTRCLRSGVRLAANSGELRVHYDGDLLDTELLALLRSHKQELLQYLDRRSAASISVLPAADRGVMGASMAQRRMWLLDRLENVGGAYNMVGAYRLSGAFHAQAMHKSLKAVVLRHEALRTTFADVDDELRQFIQTSADLAFECIDLSAFLPEQQSQRWQQLLERENTWRFDLTTGPLLRATCVDRGSGNWALVLNIHHIACDGWSIDILERDIGAAYAAFSINKPTALPPARSQYADYVAWQEQQVDDALWRRHLDYWKTTLEGMPALHSLPLDKPRPPVQVYAGGTVSRRMPGSWLHAVEEHCRASEVTLFMYLHAALAAVLSVYANEQDIVVAFPVVGRAHADVNETVGLFVNTLVLRTRIEGNPTFEDMLAGSRRTVLDALEHQALPFDALVDALRPERSRSYSPLAQILLVLQNRVGDGLDLAGLDVNAIDNPDASVKFDLQVEAARRGGDLVIQWRFNRSLFDQASIARVADSLDRLLHAVVGKPRLLLFSLPLATAESAPRAYTDAVPAEAFPRLEERFKSYASRYPERVAVALGKDVLTYGELDRRADALAAVLRARDIKRGDLVALCTHSSPETIVGLLGALKAGAAYVPLDPSHPAARLCAIVDDCGAAVVLTQHRLATGLAPLGKPLIALDELPDPSDDALAVERDPADSSADPAYVIYTSGTTGTPKGVVVAHAGVVNLVDYFETLSPLSEPWSGSLWGSLSFDLTIYEIFTVLCRGGTLHIVPEALRIAPEGFFRWLDEHHVASTFMHAGYLEPFIEYLSSARAGHSLRRMMVGVEPIASDYLYAIVQKLPALRIINAYGPTETTVCSTLYPFDASRHVDGARVPIGRAVGGLTLHVMNAGGGHAPDGAVGELYVGGIGLALGYLNNPAMNEARFVAVPVEGMPRRLYRTGDLVRYRIDGELEFVGRADEQIKIRGFRVEPGEIEVRLCQQTAVSDAVVVATGDGIGRRLVAYVVPKGVWTAHEGDAFAAKIKLALRHNLPGYMIPDDIVALAAIPLTVNGKVNRTALPPIAVSHAGIERVAPRNDIERRLVAIWKAVLDVDEVGVTDDFFALGGQSLIATRLIGRIRREFLVSDTELPFGVLFENPTIETFAGFLATPLQVSAASAIQRVVDRSGLPVSYAQRRIWLTDFQSTDGSTFNIQGCFVFAGSLELGHVEQTLRQLLRRHEALRTGFFEEAGELRQRIDERADINLTVVDLRHRSDCGQIEAADRFIRDDLMRRFDLSVAPLLRMGLLRLADDRHLAIFNMHHIISDGWSVGLLIEEFCEAYTACHAGTDVLEALVPLQYGDYAAWQQQYLQGEVLDNGLDFWREYLQAMPEVHSLPIDKSRPAQQSFAGDVRRGLIGRDLEQRIRQYCQSQRSTLFMFLQTALSVLLGTYGNENDIVMGTPVAGRTLPEMESIIGLFINTVVLRTRVDPSLSFDELLRSNAKRIAAAFDHQHIPFELLAKQLGHKRSQSYSPLFQVWFVLQNNRDVVFSLPGCTVSEYESVPPPAAKYELNLYAKERQGGIELEWVFNPDIFDHRSIDYVAHQFLVLLERIVDAPGKGCLDHGLFAVEAPRCHGHTVPSAVERLVAPGEWVAVLKERLAAQPSATVLVCEERAYTYRELAELSERYVAVMDRAGVSCVGLLLNRGVDMVAAMLAALMSRKAYVPLDPDYPRARLHYMVGHAGCDVLITEGAHMDIARDIAGTVHIACGPASQARAFVTSSGIERAVDPFAYILYTSGSTGQPKGVYQTHSGLAYHAGSYACALDLCSDDRILQLASYSFDASVLDTYGALVAGATLYLADVRSSSGDTILRLIDDAEITVYHSTPTVFKQLFSQAVRGTAANLRMVVMGGEPVDEQTIKLFERVFGTTCRLVGLYGATESSLTMLGDIPIDSSDDAHPGLGYAIDGTEVFIRLPDGSRARIFEIGEIAICSGYLAGGYWRDAPLTEERFAHDEDGIRFYLTGDTGYRMPDGSIRFAGRRDFQVKLNGIRIELGEIEAALHELDDIGQVSVAIVDGDGDHRGGRLVAYVVSAEVNAAATSRGDIVERQMIGVYREQLSRWLPDYMMPSAFVFLPELPRSPSGKIDRKALRDIAIKSRQDIEYVGPRSAMEESICDMWQQVLERDRVGIRSEFFELGGDSLLATRLLNRVREVFSIESADYSMREFFKRPTIEAMAERISSVLTMAQLAGKRQALEQNPQDLNEGVF